MSLQEPGQMGDAFQVPCQCISLHRAHKSRVPYRYSDRPWAGGHWDNPESWGLLCIFQFEFAVWSLYIMEVSQKWRCHVLASLYMFYYTSLVFAFTTSFNFYHLLGKFKCFCHDNKSLLFYWYVHRCTSLFLLFLTGGGFCVHFMVAKSDRA